MMSTMSGTLIRTSLRLPTTATSPRYVIFSSQFQCQFQFQFQFQSLSSQSSGDKGSKKSSDELKRQTLQSKDQKNKNVNILKSLGADIQGSSSRFEVDELKRVAETTLSEQQKLLTQKWDEVKSGWKKEKSEGGKSKEEEETTQEW